MARFHIFTWLLPLLLALHVAVFVSARPLDERAPAAGPPVATIQGGVNTMGGGTYPRAIFLKDGSMLGTYTSFNGDTVINVAKSTDQGVTWTAIGLVASAPAATRDLDNGFPLQLPSGRIVCAFRNHDKNGNDYTTFRISLCYSDDNGVTWTFLSEITHPGPKFNGLWEPFLRIATDGSLQMYYSHELDSTNQVNLMQPSFDGGATWAGAVTVSQLNRARDGMIGVASTGGMNLVAVFESSFDGQFTVNQVTSADGGTTWGPRTEIIHAGGNNNNAGVPQLVAVGSNLVTLYMTDEDTSQHDWFQGCDVKLVTSGDGGATWGNKLTVSPAQTNWPGLIALDASNFLAMFDFNGAKTQKISLA